ncbi:acyl-CoA dehydrogenase, N-terminal domain protein [Mycobacterium kansasii 732]|nr:acyl-CoA dehydrogenase, N-terminal domain protein [Mycobacterium kansasii 732]
MIAADLLYSDTEEALRDSVRQLFADRCPPELVMRAYDAPPQDFSEIWRTLAADLGVAGLLVPESLGGAGASAREAAVVMEEIGRAVAPVPFLSSAVLAAVALSRSGETETLSGLAGGAVTAALVVPLSTAPGDPVTAVSNGADGLTGRVSSVAGAREADVLVVPVAGPDGVELHTVARDAAGVVVSPLLTFDMTRSLADVQFSGAASARIGTGRPKPRWPTRCRPQRRCWPPSSWGLHGGALTPHWPTSSSVSSSAGPSGPIRRSNTASRICGSRSVRQRRPPAMPPTRVPGAMQTPRLRRRWRRPTAAALRCTPPRNACSCTAESA